MTNERKWVLASFGLLAVSACNGRTDSRSEHVKPSEVAAAAQPTNAKVGAVSRAKPQLIPRPAGARLEHFVQQQVEEADAQGMRVLVYVGAEWCEPCKHFHEALSSGDLDTVLAGTKLIELDADRDRADLRAAGYASKYIPLFSVPDHSGHASGRAVEGSIKGAAAVKQDLVPRLLSLLDRGPTG
jgi:thiol:disulfide interchange protein